MPLLLCAFAGDSLVSLAGIGRQENEVFSQRRIKDAKGSIRSKET
jgi:hypothetical protein